MNFIAAYRKEIKETLVLALPLTGAQLAQISLNFTDVMMVGRLDSESLAAIGLAGAIYFPIIVIAMGMVMAVGPMVSQAFGAKDHEAIERSVRQGLWLAVALTIPCWIIMYVIPSFLTKLGQAEEVVPLASAYLHNVMWSVLPALCFIVLKGFLDSLSKPRIGLMITLTGVVVNIIANYILMFGKLGFPALGVAGTGIATTTVNTWMFLGIASYVRWSKAMAGYHIFSQIRKPDLVYFREIFRIGWPIGIAFGIEVILFATTAILIGAIGKDELAAHQIAINCASVTFMLAVGFALASTVRVGQAIGRGDLEGASRAGTMGMILGVTTMGIMGILFLLFPKFFIALYIDTTKVENQAVMEIAIQLLMIAAAFQVFDALQVTAAGALRGIKDTRTPMFVGLLAYWCIGLTSGYLMGFYWGGDAIGLWWGLVIGLGVASVLLTLKFRYYFKNKSTIQGYHSMATEKTLNE